MKTILSAIIIATTFLLCSCPKCKDCNGGNTNIDTTSHTQATPADTMPPYIIKDAIDMDGYPNYTCESMQIDTFAKMSVCPVIVKDTSSDNTLFFVIVSSNRTDILFLNTCNILIDKTQYASEWAGTILNEGKLEIQMFALDEHLYGYILNADEIAFAFWGTYGSVIQSLDDVQKNELKSLVSITKNIKLK